MLNISFSQVLRISLLFHFTGWNILPPPMTLVKPTKAPPPASCVFKCTNGECLDCFNKICDGILDCKGNIHKLQKVKRDIFEILITNGLMLARKSTETGKFKRKMVVERATKVFAVYCKL